MKTRPLGITILSILFIIGGSGMLILFLSTQKIDIKSVASLSSTVMFNGVLLGVWALVAGIGMWFGKKWGWWLGATYLSYSVFRNINVLFTIFTMLGEFPIETRHIVKPLGRVLIHASICTYCFKDAILEFFGFSTERKGKKL